MAIRTYNINKLRPAAQLYRDFLRELPIIYDVFDLEMPKENIKTRIKYLIRKNADIQDDRVIEMLTMRGYLSLEEAVLQHKTRTQVLDFIEPLQPKKKTVVQTNQDFMSAFLEGGAHLEVERFARSGDNADNDPITLPEHFKLPEAPKALE